MLLYGVVPIDLKRFSIFEVTRMGSVNLKGIENKCTMVKAGPDR